MANPLPPPPTIAGPRRFDLVTTLRGLAASWVVMFHIWTSTNGGVTLLPRWLGQVVFKWGYLGVEIFFVLSGYVIAHSLRDKSVDGDEAKSFAAKRYLRIAPPYYVSLLAVFAVAGLKVAIDHKPFILNSESFSVGRLIAHLFFAQQFLGIKNFEEIYWTLCYEMGFYLVMIAILWLLCRRGHRNLIGPIAAATGVASAVVTFFRPEIVHWLYLLNGWYMFAAGLVAYECARGVCRKQWFVGLLTVIIAMALVRYWGKSAVAAATAGLLYWDYLHPAEAGSNGWLRRVIASRPMLFLGTISYSLYLLHAPIRTTVLQVWTRVLGKPSGLAEFLGLYATQFAASVIGAWILWKVVERPSVALAGKVGRRRTPRVSSSTVA